MVLFYYCGIYLALNNPKQDRRENVKSKIPNFQISTSTSNNKYNRHTLTQQINKLQICIYRNGKQNCGIIIQQKNRQMQLGV